MSDRGGRRFWTCDDITKWLIIEMEKHNTYYKNVKAAEADSVWWCCYRETEVLLDDTCKHIAQALMGGMSPYTAESVTDFVQQWMNDDGDEGDLPGIDDAIEKDLREFFDLPQSGA